MPAIGVTSAALESATPRRDDDYRRLLEQRRTHTAGKPAHRVAVGGPGRNQTAARHRHAAADRARQRARITTRRHG